LLLYTDGLVERRGELLDEGLDRVRAVAGRLAATDPERLTGRLLAEVLADTAQPDDVAVIAARLLPEGLDESLPADPARLAGIRRTVRAWAAATGLTEEIAEDLQLALGEALANAVEHAYAAGRAGECSYRVNREPDGSVRVQVQDAGTWRPPPEDRGHRGRGLELITALALDVEVAPAAGNGAGTTVGFRLRPRDGSPDDVPRRFGPDDGARASAAAVLPVGAGEWGDAGTARLLAHEDVGGVRLEIAGELDLASVGAVHAALSSRLGVLPAGASAVLDLGPTSYLASAGVGMVLQVLAEAADRGVTLRVRTAPGTPPARVLALAGLAEGPAGDSPPGGPEPAGH